MSEIVLIGGMPAGGKTSITKLYTEKGYVRLNRDTVGGKVADLLVPMASNIRAGKNVVLDNLYATKANRAEFIKVAADLGVPIHFVHLATSFEDAQFNACVRMMERCGKILHPEDHKLPEYKTDPNLFPVAVLYKYRKEFEKPTVAEGFTNVSTVKFVREYPTDWVNEAVIFDFDGTLRTHVGPQKYPTSPDQVRAFTERSEQLKKLGDLYGIGNMSGVGEGILSKQDADACYAETAKQLGVKFRETLYCPHKVPPITCYCRKPGPGLGVELIYNYKLDPRKCTYVGDLTTDKTFAARCGFKFAHESDYFRS